MKYILKHAAKRDTLKPKLPPRSVGCSVHVHFHEKTQQNILIYSSNTEFL